MTHPHVMTHHKKNTWVIKASDDIPAPNIPYERAYVTKTTKRIRAYTFLHVPETKETDNTRAPTILYECAYTDELSGRTRAF
jgi:hypothetical protein